MRTLVLGLGNDIAGDDAVGVLVARALREDLDGLADAVESSASGMALIEVLAGYDRVVVVDAVRTGRYEPGEILEMGLSELGPVRAPSLHQAGLPELAAVAGRLGLTFPERTVVLAVEVVDPYTIGAAMSDPVRRVLPELTRRVRAQVQRWRDEDEAFEASEAGEARRARLPGG
jgi:hydrogenase maturation protease